MLLESKKILIMGIRNKWSIAFGIAQSVYENGGKLIFTYRGDGNKEKIEELVSEFKGSKIYALDDASDDEQVKSVFENIKEENGKIDGIVHSIAHANTEDLHNDFIYTSKNGYLHAMETSAYSLLLATRTAKEIDMLNEHSSIVTLTYHGSTKVINGYNVMGAAKAALEANVRYLAENIGKEEMRVNFRQASDNNGIPSSVFFSSLPYSHLIFCSVFSQYDFTSFLYIFRYFCTFSNKNIQKHLADYFL